MNWFDPIIQILSNHRHPRNSDLPQALTKSQLTNLLKNYPTPQNHQFSASQIQDLLNELTARGEILSSIGKRYCMAPPAVLTQDKTTTSSVRFQGDRAYLPLVHQILETNQDHREIIIQPRVHRQQYIQDRLAHVGVRLITLSQYLAHLPKPHQPSKPELRSPWGDNPFALEHSKQPIWHYSPNTNATQSERWRAISTQPPNASLIRLHSGNYLWYDTQAFYELEPDTALLTTFWLDQKLSCPLKLPWDSAKGLLHLKQTSLPSTYARWIWALSEANSDHYRTRYIAPENRPLIVKALQQLGCLLV